MAQLAMAERRRVDENCPLITVTPEGADRKTIFPPLNQNDSEGHGGRHHVRTPTCGSVRPPSNCGDAGTNCIPPLTDGSERVNPVLSRPTSSAFSINQRLIGSPPPAAFRQSAARTGRKWPLPYNATGRDTPIPGNDCPTKINPPGYEEGENSATSGRQRTMSHVSVLSTANGGRSRNPSNDGFKEVTFVQTLSAPSTAMRSLSRASLTHNSLTPPPRILGVSSDSSAGALEYVQEVPSEITAKWGHDEQSREATPVSDNGEDGKLDSSYGSGHNKKEFRLHSIADLVNLHRNREDNVFNVDVKIKATRPVSSVGNGMKTKVYRLKPLQGEPEGPT